MKNLFSVFAAFALIFCGGTARAAALQMNQFPLPAGIATLPNEDSRQTGFLFDGGMIVDISIKDSVFDLYWNSEGMPGKLEIGGMVDIGLSSIDEVTSAPAFGYQAFPDRINPAIGRAYAVFTHDRKYGILEITDISEDFITFKWKYQPDGSRNFW
jgi:hypothetical protein